MARLLASVTTAGFLMCSVSQAAVISFEKTISAGTVSPTSASVEDATPPGFFSRATERNRPRSGATFTLPKFDDDLGTLTQVEILFTMETIPLSQNQVRVDLDPCAGGECEKELTVFSRFTYGIDTDAIVGAQDFGISGERYDLGVTPDTQINTFSLADTPTAPSSGVLGTGVNPLDSDYASFTSGLDNFIYDGTGDDFVLFEFGTGNRTRLDIQCMAAGAGPIGDCEETVEIRWNDWEFNTWVRYSFNEAPDFGDFDLGNIFLEPIVEFPEDLTVFSFQASVRPTGPVAVPVPASVYLLLGGLGVLSLIGRRRA